MKTPIERITGFACEVDKSQWEELVRVAKSVGCCIDDHHIEFAENRNGLFAYKSPSRKSIGFYSVTCGQDLIPFPDFLAKLKGEETWVPKNGEEVEVRDGVGTDWFAAKFIGNDGGWSICRPGNYPLGHYTTHNDVNIRQVRPTITRQEAEAILNKRIID